MRNRRQILVAGLAAALPLPALAQTTESIGLENGRWRIEITPQTLGLTVLVKDQSAISISRGIGAHAVSDLVQTPNTASWSWDGGYRLACALDGDDFRIDITAAAAGSLDIIDQPGEAFGRGLIYPRAEGHYLPAGDATWQDHLTGEDDIDTSQALSLPLWGQDHGAFVLTWLLLNPFNNKLTFVTDNGQLAPKLNHTFTSLSPATPMSVILHLGNDLTAGARRYRQHLIDTGAYQTLDDKIARTPEAARLIGASHTYLWGGSLLLDESDVRNWPAFMKALNGPSDLATRLRASFDADTAPLLKASKPYAYQQSALIGAINDGLLSLARLAWQTGDIDLGTLCSIYGKLRGQMAATFGTALAPDPAHWGKGLTGKTLAALQKAGLDKLLICMGDGWEGGLWHPEAVGDFVTAGYLIAPYDSYETAIAPGVRPDWATAQLGKAAYETMGVMRMSGNITKGFQQTGVYTNSVSVLPLLKARVAALAKTTGFNGWFIDCYTTGMVFDDYRPGHEMTMAENAASDEASLRWISETLHLPVGSEDGNATTVGGAVFAHGMQTPVMGWGDPDLQKDKDSPYYLGNWFPSDGPGIFFKTVPLKEPYRTLHFAPQTRLPLYQSVFHGSMITTHHWSYDSLKFSNVAPESELAQLLYNVPPLYHLNDHTLATRLPVMKKQDVFFRPLHEALAKKAMEGFAYLSDDHLVQMTTFSDGSRLVANFDTTVRQAEGHDLPAGSLMALLAGQAPQVYVA